MAGGVRTNIFRLVSPDGLVEKDLTINNSGNPLYDSAQLAKQSDIGVANSSLVKTAVNASGDAPIYACRAWVNFNGTGTVAIRASGNVTSITDNGTGSYTVNFTTAMPDANYTCVVTTGFDSTSNTGIRGANELATDSVPSTTSVRVGSWSNNTSVNRSADDSPYMNVAIFR